MALFLPCLVDPLVNLMFDLSFPNPVHIRMLNINKNSQLTTMECINWRQLQTNCINQRHNQLFRNDCRWCCTFHCSLLNESERKLLKYKIHNKL